MPWGRVSDLTPPSPWSARSRLCTLGVGFGEDGFCEVLCAERDLIERCGSRRAALPGPGVGESKAAAAASMKDLPRCPDRSSSLSDMNKTVVVMSGTVRATSLLISSVLSSNCYNIVYDSCNNEEPIALLSSTCNEVELISTALKSSVYKKLLGQ